MEEKKKNQSAPMELQKGLPHLIQQYKALLKKNLILAWRNKTATFLQLFSSLFFLAIMFAIDRSTQASNKAGGKELRDPPLIDAGPIPRCETKHNILRPCFDFAWSGNRSELLSEIVRTLRESNPGRQIPDKRVKSFRTTKEVDQWLSEDPMRTPVVLHLHERNETTVSYGLQTNSTPVKRRGVFEDPTFKFQIPLQVAAERAIARVLMNDGKFFWNVGFKEFPHSGLKVQPTDTMNILGAVFFLAITMFCFVFQMGSLVAEKELKLRQAMSTMGLYESAYWLSWITWEGFMSFLSAILTVLFGMMFRFDLFKKNSFLITFFLFYLFQLNLTGFAFMISAFVTKANACTALGFSMFILSFVCQTLSSAVNPYSAKSSTKKRVLWSLFPPNLFNQGLTWIIKMTSPLEFKSHPHPLGITWSKRAACNPEGLCVMTPNDVYRWLLGTFFLWIVLALYFDNIMPNSYGVRKPLFYFLNPGYWTGSGGGKVAEGSIFSFKGSGPSFEEIPPDDKDVLEEENVVKEQAKLDSTDPGIAVQLRGLRKTYAGTTSIGCCCKTKKTKPYHAIRGLWMNIAKDQLYCLLGPNGAGKTTTINCLTGLMPITSGDALIYGYSISSSVDMSNIRRIIGVCPQFDILWDMLTAEEHLRLFANIKGLSPAATETVIQDLLAEVKISHVSRIISGSYSGGMKRRLSVAIALIGDPKLVFLDEPTTGMDPITRRHVWDVIQSAKRGRAIILTTHSMEEADILGDRIGIMAKGRLRCIGTSIRLKSRFGTGFIANVSFSGSPHASDSLPQEAVKQFFREHLGVQPEEETKTFLTFVIPHAKEKLLTKFFTELEDRKVEFDIADIQLSLTTLEEVFLNIAKQAEMENAAEEGSLVVLTLTSGTLLQIPVGARFVGIPGTESSENPKGIMVEVFWEQDESGVLCISGHSHEISIPGNVTPKQPPRPASDKDVEGDQDTQLGLIIDPSQIDLTLR